MAIVCPEFSELDSEIKQEFYEDVEMAIRDINECANELERSVDDGVIDRMFRAIHTVKGNCNMVFLVEFVATAHQLEDLFSLIRSKTIEYHSAYGRFAILVVNLILQQLKTLIETQSADEAVLGNIKLLIKQVMDEPNETKSVITEKAILAIEEGHFNISLIALDSNSSQAFSFSNATDSEFFEYVASQHQQNPQNELFFSTCTVLAAKLNELLSNSVDTQQLHAATIFLNLSQNVMPDGSMNELSFQQCIIASGFLSRMSGWSIASELCLQAMEKHDGSGQPNSLKDSQIHPAAQVLALAFEFAFHVVQNNHSEYKNSLFSAVKSINSKKDTKYKDRLIQRFNQVIKSDYLTKNMF